MDDDAKPELIELTASIVASYVQNNAISAGELPGLIKAAYAALTGAGLSAEPEPLASMKATPAQIRKSITPDGLISFEDGKLYKSMKRNLALRGLTPQAYREKWGLPHDYPMVSPAYSASRSALAKSMGLGSGRRTNRTVTPAVALATAKAPKAGKSISSKAAPQVSPPKKKAGRPPKAIDPAQDDFT